jgi:hypothetical protein
MTEKQLNKKAVVSAPQPKNQDREDLVSVYRRTTKREFTSNIWTGEELGEDAHAVRSFLWILPTNLVLSKAFSSLPCAT